MKMNSIFLLALAIVAVPQTSYATEEEFEVVFNSKIELPINASRSSKQVEKEFRAPNSITSCTVSLEALPFSQPVIPANRKFRVKPDKLGYLHDEYGLIHLYEASTDKEVARIHCKYYEMKPLDALKATLDVVPSGIKVYEIKADEDESIHQNDGSTPTAI